MGPTGKTPDPSRGVGRGSRHPLRPRPTVDIPRPRDEGRGDGEEVRDGVALLVVEVVRTPRDALERVVQ